MELDARAEYMTEWILTFVADSHFIYSQQEVALFFLARCDENVTTSRSCVGSSFI